MGLMKELVINKENGNKIAKIRTHRGNMFVCTSCLCGSLAGGIKHKDDCPNNKRKG